MELWLGLLCKPEVVDSMSLAGGPYLSMSSKSLQPILTNRLQHHEAWFAILLLRLLKEALVDEGGYPFQHPHPIGADVKEGTDRFDRFKCAAAHKNGEPAEESLLCSI